MPPHLSTTTQPLHAKDRILVVDDNISNLKVISELLSNEQFELSIATNGKRALTQIKSFVPDLILLDIMMPEMGGFETCRRIKADEETCDIPIIFMTALADVKNKVKGLSLGTVDYITKPFQAEEVLARINMHLAHQRTKQSLKISEEKLKASEKRLNSILSSLKEVVWSASLAPFEFSFLNRAVETVYGISVEAFQENPHLWLELIHEEDRDLVNEQWINIKPTSEHQNLEYRIVRADGDIRWISCQYRAYLDPQTSRLCLDGIVQDISERKRAELKLLFRAQHDNLTKLANRAYFMKRLEQRLKRPRAHEGEKFGILFIDLDGFKTVNDNLGHHIGDQLLVTVSERLLESVRNIDLVARLGGDEFTVLIQQVNSLDQLLKTCDRIQQNFEQPFQLGEHSLNITASVGIAMNNRCYESADEMMRDADVAMYQAKNHGKDCFQIFDGQMYEEEIKKNNLGSALKHALENDEFQLDYHPFFNLQTKLLTGFEVLVRWHHPQHGKLLPTEFISIAEEAGLMPTLGTIIIQKACAQIKQWQKLTPLFSSLKISINLSSYQLQDPYFLDSLSKNIQQAGIQFSNFQFEITENSLIKNSEINLRLLKALKERGIQICLDDFGTGYSSLSYLHKFPINSLKIDHSFIHSMESEHSSFEIIRTIISLTQALKIDVLAEGIETLTQMNALTGLNCALGQGYLFSKPLSAEETTDYLRKGNIEIQVN